MLFQWLRTPALGLLFAAFHPAEADSFELFEIRDSTLVTELWKAADLEGEPAPGHYQILVKQDWASGEKQTYLLREGTQNVELPEFALSLLRGGSKGRLGRERTAAPGEPAHNVWRGFWNRRDSVLSWLRWPTGVEVGWQNSVAETRGARVQIDRQLDLVLRQNPHPWISLEAGLHRYQTGGGLSRFLYDPLDTAQFFKFWGEGHWGWHAAIGVPGVKWELALANRPLPVFFWVDPEVPVAAAQRGRGSLIRQWEDSAVARPGNLSQAVRVRLGAFRYAAHFDFDAYQMPVQEIMLEDLPAPFGLWGVGFVLGGGVFTRLGLNLFPVSVGIPVPRSWPTALRFSFVRLDLAYRNRLSYRFNMTFHMALDNPVLRWPGVRP